MTNAESPRYSAPNTRPEFDLLRVEWIRPSPRNPRQRFDEAALDELAASIREVGLLEPVIVRPAADTSSAAPRFDLIAGERRWRAAQRAGLTDIPALIRDDVDDALQLRLALVENLQRQDLDPLEEARGYTQLQALGMTQKAIAEAVHRSQPAIANTIRLLRAPQAVQDRLAARQISPSHVLALLRYEPFPEAMVKLAEVAAERRTPTKDLEKKELGYEFDSALKEAKLAVEVSRGEFDWRAACVEACPFGAFQPAGYYGGLCLKPEHFRELQKAARAAKKAEVQEALEAAAGPDGKPALKLSQLKYGQYERLDWGGGAPKGCSKACECRAIALDSGNRPVGVCLKPHRLRQLREAQHQDEQAKQQARMQQLAEACGQVLDQVAEVRSRELAVLTMYLCSQLDRERFDQVLAKRAPAVKAREADFDDFLQLEPLALVKIAVEALLSRDIEHLQWHAKADYATWYAGSPRPAKGKTKRARKLHDPEPWFQAGDQVMLPNGDRGEVQQEVSGFVEVRDQETGEQVTIGREILRPADPPPVDPDEPLAAETAAQQECLQAEYAAAGEGEPTQGSAGATLPTPLPVRAKRGVPACGVSCCGARHERRNSVGPEGDSGEPWEASPATRERRCQAQAMSHSPTGFLPHGVSPMCSCSTTLHVWSCRPRSGSTIWSTRLPAASCSSARSRPVRRHRPCRRAPARSARPGSPGRPDQTGRDRPSRRPAARLPLPRPPC